VSVRTGRLGKLESKGLMNLLNPTSDHGENAHTVRNEQMKRMPSTSWLLKLVNIRKKKTERSGRVEVMVSQTTMTLRRQSSSVGRKKS